MKFVATILFPLITAPLSLAQQSPYIQDTTKTNLTDTIKSKAREQLPDSTELANEARKSLEKELDINMPTDSTRQ